MGGLKARITTVAAVAAAVAVVCGALALGASAAAAAESPLDAASAVSTVDQTAAAVASPATEQAGGLVKDTASVPAPSAIRETVERAAGRERRISPTTARPAARPSGRVAGPRAPAAGAAVRHVGRAPIGPRRGSAHDRGRHASPTTSSPPHGRKAMPPARSLPERAGAARAAYPHSAAPVPQHAPGETGLAGRTRELSAPGGVFLTALLIAMLAASRPCLLRPLRTPAPPVRRLAVPAPAGPPG